MSILRVLAALAVPVGFAACGGGGGGGGSTVVAGLAVDGYIRDASISCLARRSGALAVIATTVSDSAGKWRFELPAGVRCDVVEARGGVDIGNPDDPYDDIALGAAVYRTAIPPLGVEAPSSDLVIVSPITTLIASLQESDPALSPAAARERVTGALGLPTTLDPLHVDPLQDPRLYVAGSVVASALRAVSMMIDIAATSTGAQSPNDVFGTELFAQVARTLAQELADPVDPLKLADLAQPPRPALADGRAGSFAEHAVLAARANPALSGGLAGINAKVFSAIAAPQLLAATSTIAAAPDVAAAMQRAANVTRDTRTSTLVEHLVPLLLAQGATADQRAQIAAASAAVAGAGVNAKVVIPELRVGEVTASSVIVQTGFFDFVRLAGDRIYAIDKDFVTPLSLDDFQAGTAPAIASTLSAFAMLIEQPEGASQLGATPRVVAVAFEVRDAAGSRPTGERRFQAVLDRVELSWGAGGIQVALPTDAKLNVYVRNTAGARATVQLANNAHALAPVLGIDATSGRLRLGFDELFSVLRTDRATPSLIRDFATTRISDGRFDVRLAITRLVIARTTIGPASAPARMVAIPVLDADDAVIGNVSGYGFVGSLTVGRPG